ncbi:DUF2730 family protein [Sphingomonas sp. SRS2]|uniref:DUF2730 family protein n=1 Tax=Sphingomonas sp. SRS2 TaxID=133190 RepID=UPI000B0A501B|nr:DUF2730 family protein [Sphingomonas sp. SRS2]
MSLALAITVLIAGMLGLDHAWAEPAGEHAAPAVAWSDWIRAIWPILVTVIGAVGAGLYLGLAMRFPSVSAFNSLKSTVYGMKDQQTKDEGRLKRLEELCGETPTRIELQEDIAELGERMSGLEGEMKGVGQQLGTTNTYLHTLIERGLKGS